MNIVYGCASDGKTSPNHPTRSDGPALRTDASRASEAEARRCITSNSTPHLLLTIDEAAAALRIGRSHTYRYIQSGELRSVKVGRSRRVPLSALEEFVERLQAEQEEEMAL